MDITEVKEVLGIKRLELRAATTKEGATTEWFRHWDNDRRKSISMHKDLVMALKAEGSSITTLSLQREIRNGDKGQYESIRIVRHAEPDFTL